MSSSQNLKFVS